MTIETAIAFTIGFCAAALPLIAWVIKLTPTTKDDAVLETILHRIDDIESLINRDINGDGRIGRKVDGQ